MLLLPRRELIRDRPRGSGHRAPYLPTANDAFARVDAAEWIWRATAADVAVARGVYDHIVAHRNDYLATHSAEQVDWMVQNARVIVQVVEGIAGITPRDLSMAENVEWILDRAPAGSKIVLWAHNSALLPFD